MHSVAENNISATRETEYDFPARVLLAAGGTGGHVYPAIAIADALCQKNSKTEILFVGTKSHMEWEAVPRAGYDIKDIWISGFHRRFTLKNLLFPFKLVTSIVQSLNIINRFKPDIVISCGGYVAGPVGWVANRKKIPLIIQEQNSYPGVTNRLLADKAEKIFTAFKEADAHFPKEKTEIAGNPTREILTKADSDKAYNAFGFEKNRKTLLVLGGSGGAKTINEAMKNNVDFLHNELGLQIIWQCGKRYYDQLKRDIDANKYKNLLLTDFLQDMPEAYAVADMVVSRAGAITCSELLVTAKPSILVPSPNVAGDHQTKNAKSLVNEGAAEMITDDKLKNRLGEVVNQIIFDDGKLEKMSQSAKKLARPEASETIATEILELLNKKKKSK